MKKQDAADEAADLMEFNNETAALEDEEEAVRADKAAHEEMLQME